MPFLIVLPMKCINWLLLTARDLAVWTLQKITLVAWNDPFLTVAVSLWLHMSRVWPVQHLLVPFPCRSWPLSCPYKNVFSVRLHLRQAPCPISRRRSTGLIFAYSWCDAWHSPHGIFLWQHSSLTWHFPVILHEKYCAGHWGPSRPAIRASFYICLELMLPLETSTMFVKKKGFCWKQYCLGLGSNAHWWLVAKT